MNVEMIFRNIHSGLIISAMAVFYKALTLLWFLDELSNMSRCLYYNIFRD